MKYLTLVFMMFMLACEAKLSPEGSVWVEDQLYYFEDCRTNVCFAVWSAMAGPTIATVPCGNVSEYLMSQCKHE